MSNKLTPEAEVFEKYADWKGRRSILRMVITPEEINKEVAELLQAQGLYTREWREAKNPPEESGRYWCYVSEVDDLGISHYQWNCAYSKEDDRWSDKDLTGRITHWMPLPTPPTH